MIRTLQKSGVVKIVVRGPAPRDDDVVVAESVCVVVIAEQRTSSSHQTVNHQVRSAGWSGNDGM